MDRNKTVIFAICLSLAAHSIFLALSPHIKLKGMNQMMDQTKKMFRIREVEKRTEKVSLFKKEKPKVPSIKMSSQLLSGNKGIAQDMFLEKDPAKDLSSEKKKEEARKEEIKNKIDEDMNKTDASDMLKAEEERARKAAAPKKRSLEDLLASEILVVHRKEGSDSEILGDEKSREAYRSLSFNQKISASGGYSDFQPGSEELLSTYGRTQVGEYEDIGRYLDVALTTYLDPVTKEGYFELLIKVKDGSKLEVVPKEIVFLIDSSKSITAKKLDSIKLGVIDSLKRLNPKDRFNIVAFRGDLIKFEETSVPVSSRIYKKAVSFVDQLEAVGQTDVENALLDIIEEPIVSKPSYILLSTDGRPTMGVVDSRRIIQQITRKNKMERPIFCFGGGKRVNKYLLDFISYQNRAWSRFAPTSYDMRGDFDELYSQIKEPILLNVRYLLNGLDISEVYPKYLSDFYQGRPFVLYGRFRDEDRFSMQLLGRINGNIKEFIFERFLTEADAGGREIAEAWAFHKIYFLISQNTMGFGDPVKLRGEIDELSRMYGITTPYDIEEDD